jgi:hypothetical protein
MNRQHKADGQFNDQIKQHLAEYRQNRLGINETGIWHRNGRTYPHILPENRQQENILAAIRAEFWRDFAEFAKRGVKLHDCFHHLNSSQALCFNLFYPFMRAASTGAEILQMALELPPGQVKMEFEKVMDADEGTNFDFYMEYATGPQIFFELKYTENEFGAAKPDAKHLRKYTEIYQPRLAQILVPERRGDSGFFLRHYQIFRNLLYLPGHDDSQVFFIFPRENSSLAYISKLLQDSVMPEFLSRCHILHLDTLVARLRQQTGAHSLFGIDTAVSLIPGVLDEFAEKYLLERHG